MEHRLRTPISQDEVAALRAGDLVWISGTVYTARDRVHALLATGEELPVDLVGAVIYHCGPLIRDATVLSAGPTTSGRVGRFTREVVDRGVRLIVGKGGISEDAEALRGRATYLAYPGGCGALAARHLLVRRLHLPDLGMAEGLWELEAEGWGPMIVAIDSFGGDLYREAKRSEMRSE
ncbi:fumarate hydratase C-terminal domain-containing protein [Methanotrichaceae archaeon M04Ac]|jgi:fumarate hydratase subunit beta|uniref:Fumarate hydratase C-terminal domain-containing protein n=1 Tax=Candidatus Methanocrinis alkalitolerans TaxID=3033395 RepID=A0ABT5XGP9_9EURY|nr:fumarate hydratase C-terminal domain-containing protein [Candidatus Methanocrinis alkalitolerans]MCR3884325.1 fumarate hydratase C-terminal domain-containing protein [Methanothrix sp.]MDF0593894.1 fumarate hydratase C-terminal domain-containing protein [Candidatus Methanocrinis alkalitolerans]